MLYLIHENGRIIQSNKVYSTDKLPEYEEVMRESGQQFIRLDAPGLINSDTFYVKDESVCPRPAMMIPELSKLQLKADGKDQIIISGVPKGARVNVMVGPYSILDASVDDGSIELISDTPGILKVTIEAFPFIPWTQQFEAVA